MNNISLGTYRRQKNTWKHVITISHYKQPHSVIITCLSEQLKLKTNDSSKIYYKFRETVDGWHGSMGNDINSIPKTHMVGENWFSQTVIWLSHVPWCMWCVCVCVHVVQTKPHRGQKQKGKVFIICKWPWTPHQDRKLHGYIYFLTVWTIELGRWPEAEITEASVYQPRWIRTSVNVSLSRKTKGGPEEKCRAGCSGTCL